MKIYFGGDGKMRAVAESEDDVRELLAMKDRKPVEKPIKKIRGKYKVTTECPACGKKVKKAGLTLHTLKKHPVVNLEQHPVSGLV